MKLARFTILLAFLAVLLTPLLFRSGDSPSMTQAGGEKLIIVTPHHDQIRHEFGIAFAEWHESVYGEPAQVIWSTPGGTSEIRKLLQSEYEAALRDGRTPGGNADLVWGGGSYEFEQFRMPLRVIVDGEQRTTTITEPVSFDQDWLDERYGPNEIGDAKLYDPEGYWFGTALSGFGLVFNRDVLTTLGLPEPTHWQDLAAAQLQGWVALVNPGQSGSVTTAFHIILQRLGWNDGWAILRRAGANSRYFSASSTKPPIDISQGEAAMGVCIDFYGRYQAQAIASAGGIERVGYIDPAGLTAIDPDPIALLRGAPNRALALRFIEFTLTDHAQLLWQLPTGMPGEGPRSFELRRLPIKRSVYAKRQHEFVDNVNAFELAAPIEKPNETMRSFVALLFQAMVMDVHHDLREAWAAITRHPAYPADAGGVVGAADVSDPQLKRMLELFDAYPLVPGPDGSHDLGDVGALDTIKSGWLRSGWADAGLWHPEATPGDVLREQLGAYFRANYQQIVRISQS